jgi:hypothetical protein
MSKDPAFLFYDADAARDVSHMNRLERGCYFDLIQAQRKFGGYTVEQARKILGKDFDSCWDALTLILLKEDDLFYIEWVRESIENRKVFAENQRKRIQDYWDKKKKKEKKELIPRNNGGISTDIPYENEDVIVNENVIDNDIEELYKSVIIFFDENCRPKTVIQKKEWIDTLDKLVRIDNYSPEHIQDVIKRTRMDDFWRTNFLSVLKLRKKNKEGIMYFTVFENRKIKGNGKTRVHTADEYAADRI